MLSRLLSLVLLSLCALGSPASAQEAELFTGPTGLSAVAADFPAGFYTEDAASGATFNTPVAVKVAPDGRIFVVEKRGRIYVIKNGQKLATPFLDIEAEVLNSNDRGLLGFELDPDFAQNGHVYLLYTVDHDGTGDRLRKDVFGRLTRYTVNPSNPDRANLASRRILIGPTFSTGIPACYYSHAPGTLAFGSDGTLLVGTGDGAHYNNTDSGGQDPECFGPGKFGPMEDIGSFRSLWLGSMAGKILRVDPATGLGLPSNPFYTGNAADNQSRVWAYGLRNPYRFDALADGSTDPADGDPGLVLAADVGWQKWEEINVVRSGEGYGWPCFEGEGPLASYQNANPSHSSCSEVASTLGTQTKPDVFWHHLDASLSRPAGRTGRAIVGGDVYEGTKYPTAYQGDFFYADYPRGWMAVGRLSNAGTFSERALFSGDTGAVVDFEYDPTTEHMLYVNVGEGRVYRLRHSGGDSNNPPVAQASGDVLQGAAPLAVQFSSAGSFDPDGDAFTTRWTFGDGTASNQANPSHTFQAPGVYTVRLRLTDAFNVTATTTLTVTVGGTEPIAIIDAPEAGASGGVGQTVQLRGSAVDPDAPPEALNYLWEVSQVHNDHEHFDVFSSTQQNTSFTLTEHGNPEEVVYYVVKLTVTDGSGLSDSVEQPFYLAPDGDGLPAPWAHTDIGPVLASGDAAFNGSAFSVEGGGDVWGNADAFHYAYRPMGGDGAITARIADLTGAHPWAKVGLMVRSNLDRSAQHAMLFATPARGVHFQYRPSQSASTVEAVGQAGAAPVWLRIQRTGDVLTALTSQNGTDWATLGSVAVPMGTGVHVGLMASATDYEGRRDLASGLFTDVTVGPVADAPPPAGLPAPWQTADIGPVTTPGAASGLGGTFSLAGSGDIWGNADAFRFVHRTLSGDGSITARLAGLTADYGWSKVGLMMRESLARGSRHAMMILTPENGSHLQYRAATGGSTSSTTGPPLAAPAWLRLVRSGAQVSAFVSEDGAVWSLVSTASVAMGAEIEVGLVASATDFEGRGDLASGTFDSVTFFQEGTPGGGLPAPWQSVDIGPVAVDGGASLASGVFTVEGAGDTWGNADALHFAYQPIDGDATITARLTDISAAHPWAKVGVMIRSDLSRQSAHATLFATPARGVHLQHRTASGASTQSLAAPAAFAGAPVWLQLQRSGDVLSASVSNDGTTWENLASLSIPMGQSVYVGLSSTSTDYEGRGDTARGTYEQVMVDGQAGAVARPFTPEAGLGVAEFALEAVYPNPFRGSTTARLAIAEPGDYTVDVLDMLGRRVLTRDIREEASGVVRVALDLSGMGSGTYLVRVRDRQQGRALVQQVLLVR